MLNLTQLTIEQKVLCKIFHF